jgi:LPXTG-motif cell wall-anchored protein
MYNLPHTGFGSILLAVAALVQTGIGALMVRFGRRR